MSEYQNTIKARARDLYFKLSTAECVGMAPIDVLERYRTIGYLLAIMDFLTWHEPSDNILDRLRFKLDIVERTS